MQEKQNVTRRDFIKTSAGAMAALAATTPAIAATQNSGFDAKGLPTRALGSTGVQVPLIGFGAGSRYCSIESEDAAEEMLAYLLENGLYYWDTASTYWNRQKEIYSEERLGRVLKHRRNEIFLATKARDRDLEKTKKELETSLKRLQTDHIDLYQIHLIHDMDDVAELEKPGGVIDFMYSVREQGIAKHLGFTGHLSGEALTAMVKRHNFDHMLMAANHHQVGGSQPMREDNALPAAAAKGMGVSIMKVIRPKETVPDIDTTDLVRYALSLPGASAAVIGLDGKKVVDANVQILRNFKPMAAAEMRRMEVALDPFFKSEQLEWMNPSYQDGHWS